MLCDDLLEFLWIHPDDLTSKEQARIDAAEAELRRLRPDLHERDAGSWPCQLVKVLGEE